MAEIFKKSIFDSIHGFIHLTRCENRIVNSVYFQRLRWIKQLGWSHYIYPGATHTRFAHALGVMHVMDSIVKQLGRGVDDSTLFNTKDLSTSAQFHRRQRLAALLHDIGTFPFSHSVEQGYIAFYKDQVALGKTPPPANHEELGSHIITHTDFEGGITHILKSEGFDPEELSQLIRGKSSDVLANQLIHSDIDADRIDYLLRDSHYTGVKYGVFDMDYLISNMRAVVDPATGSEVLAINESALTSIEYFLISRYTWYSQIINEGTGYKFDLLATKISQYFIENGFIYSFEELKRLVTQKPNEFFGFQDNYFLNKLQERIVDQNPKPTAVNEMISMLLFREAPQQIKVEPFSASLVQSPENRKELVDNIRLAVDWLKEKVKDMPTAWILEDIPSKDVIFTKNLDSLRRGYKGKMHFQDSVRILDRNQKLRYLVDIPHSMVRILSSYQNFIPRIYVSRTTHKYLQGKGYLEEVAKKFGQVPVTSKSA